MNTVVARRIAVFAVLAASLSAQAAVNDLFNRPNSGNLGVDWIEQDGDSKITSNKLEANSLFSYGWCSHSAFQAPYASTVVRASFSMNGFGGDSIALIAGVDPNTWAGIEVRIADNNGDGLADRVFFNAAVNAGNWYGGSTFSNMTTPLVSGRATMWFSNAGDTVTIDILDTTTGIVQSYSRSGILALPPTGMNVGVGYFGNGNVDDFQAWTGAPTGPVFTFSTPRSLLPGTLLVAGAAPSAQVAVAYSGTGAGPIPTPLGVVGLSLPIDILFELPADANGRLELPFAAFGAMAGFTLHVQAVDLTTPALTNYFTLTFL